jgi:tetratricopeptide (TPR) repeat protein
MNRITAFVAHSFVAEDKALVAAFLEYFRQLSGLHSSFTWANAEAAEPKELAEKVKAIVADKNVVIAICTKKERVIAPSRLRKSFLQPTFVKGLESDFEWQTSDWITQEIGLAIGREMKLVLLLEDGVRLPGGLQGDLEYVLFDRRAPEKSFGKILEMLKALTPRVPTEDSATSEPPKAQEDSLSDQADDDDAWQTPRPEWRQKEFDYAVLRYMADGNAMGVSAISRAYLATEAGSDAKNAKRWEAYCEWLRIYFLQGGQLSRLKEIAMSSPDNADVWGYLGEAYSKLDHHDHAAESFRRAAELTADLQRKLYYLRRSCTGAQRSGHPEAAKALLDTMKSLADNTEESEKKILVAERATAEASKNDHILVGVLERLADLDPGDTDLRFALAYKHSELDDDDLTLFHYSLIPHDDRSALAWNNLGAAYDQLELQAKSIDAYRMAEHKGETLAMSNIANRFLRGGFVAEAQGICDKALEVPDYHKNVPSSLKRIKEIPEEEAKKENDLLERARRASDFFKRFGHAVSRPTVTEIHGSWSGPDCALQVSITGGSFAATGKYDRPSNSLFSLSYFGPSSPDAPPLRFVVEFGGAVQGRTIVGSVSRHLEGEEKKVRSLLLDDTPPKILMAIADDGEEILVYERVKKSPPTLYVLKKLI